MVESEESILASIGMLIAPVFTLCGFGDWRASVSLVTGIAAKESVASTMAVLYGGSLTGAFSTLSAFSFLVFVLLYTPCVAALTAMRKEFGSRKWMAVSVVYQLAVAWIMSFAVFQIGSLFI